MKIGRVTAIRINPKDCLSIVDLVEKLGAYKEGMSFPQAVSIALSSCLETMRQHGIVPTRDGFEFLEMMARFPTDSRSHRRKLTITAGLTLVSPPEESPIQLEQSPQDSAKARLQRKMEELLAKKNADPLNWTAAEEQSLLDTISKLHDG